MATLQFVCRRPGLKFEGFSSELVSTRSCSSSLSSNLVCRKSVKTFKLGRVDGYNVGRTIVGVRARSGGENPGDNESKQVLDAFFLGKALAETINERLGTAIGEFLSDVGRQQAEQQKKVREFQKEEKHKVQISRDHLVGYISQEEVQERAKAAAAKAAQKALAAEKSKAITSTSKSSQPPPSTSALSSPSNSPTSSDDTPPPPPPMDEDGVISIDD